ncbi:hypothetical protein BGZ72_001595 [Mortierella alpina]|nr:hypothetical protein BGZ72_001595 [Mortierella alpina]
MSSSRSPLSDRTNLPTAPTPTAARTTAAARTVSGNGQNNQATGNTATGNTAAPTTPASPPPPHRVHFSLPGHDHTFDAPHLYEELPAIPWAPSRGELRTATVGMRNAQTMLRCVEASTTLWVSEYFAELSDRFRMRGRKDTFLPIVPEDNVDSDARLDQYTRAIDGCNNISHGIKRNMRQYAATFDREVEFGGTQDTTHKPLCRYVYHGEHDGSIKRPRHAPEPVPADDTPDNANIAPVTPAAAPPTTDVVPVTTVVVHASTSNVAPTRPRLQRTESSVQDDAPPVADQSPVTPNYDRCKSCRLKYVCSNHDDDPMRAEDKQFGRLETLGSAIVLNRAKGELTFKMTSKPTTERFYRCLMAAPRMRKVNVELGPCTTAEELSTLRKNLTEANIDNIGLSATSITAPGSWYNEVLKLMVNHRCQSLSLVGFRGFYSQISDTKKPATTRLKSLALLCSFRTSQWEKLRMILKLCPALRTLTIWTGYNDQLCYNIRSELPHLKRLDFFGSTHTTIIRTSKDSYGKIVYAIELNVTAPRYLQSLPKELCSHLALLRLHWLPDPEGSLKSWFVETLRDCPRLLTFDLRVPLKHFLTLVTLLKDEFRTVNDFHVAPNSRRIVRLRSAEDDHDVTMTIKFQGHVPEFDIEVEMTGTEEGNPPLESLFRSHGSSIRSLVANHLFDNTLAEAMIESFHDRDSKLELLSIDPAGLTGSLPLLTITDRSPDLNEFTLSFSSLEDSTRQDLAETYLDRYSDRATGLLLRGGGRRSDWVTKAMPTRSRLTKIRHFEISFDEGRGRFHGEPEIRSVLQFISPSLGSAMGIPHLQSISLSSCDLTSEQWSRIMINLDLRALRYLSVEDTNFGTEEMDLLIGRLPTPTVIPRLIQQSLALPLDELVIKNTTLVKDLQILARLETKLLLRAPDIKVIID